MDGKPLHMEVDAGVSVTLISGKTWHELFWCQTLDETSMKLKTYTAYILGQEEVDVYRNKLPLW